MINMNEYNVEGGNESPLVERLEALNSILGGIRASMMINDERAESLAEKISKWEELFSCAKGHEIQIEVLREQMAEMSLTIEKFTTLQNDKANDKVIFEKFETLNALLADLRHVIDNDYGVMKAKDILPQLDELRAHQEALESRINGISYSSVTPSRLDQLENRLGDQGSVLGSLEISLRSYSADIEAQRNDLSQLRVSHEAQEGEWRHRVEGLEQWKAECLDSEGRRDASYQNLGEELKSSIVALQKEMGERQDSIEQLAAQVELLKTQRSEPQESASPIGAEIDSFKTQVCERYELLNAALLENSRAIQQVQMGQSLMDAELHQTQEKRVAGMIQELTLARGHIEDQHRKIVEEVEHYKKAHREMSLFRAQLEEKNKENLEDRREISSLREQLEGIGDTFSRQQKFHWMGLAAVFFLGLGVTSWIMPSPTLPSLESSAMVGTEQTQVIIPLDAPAVEMMQNESFTEPSTVVSTQASRNLTASTSVSASADSVQTVGPAFSRQASRTTAPVTGVSTRKIEYTVKDGDSLWKIAKSHTGDGSVTERLERIKKENQLMDGKLRRGQVLSISL